MSVADRIRGKLEAAFAPDALELIDDSARHLGHAGARPGGESHFRLTIVARAFAGMARVERQRAVMGVLKDEMAGPVHALNISALAPGE
ncbi:MAG: BolA family protein [Parvularculaceae bacterium]